MPNGPSSGLISGLSILRSPRPLPVQSETMTLDERVIDDVTLVRIVGRVTVNEGAETLHGRLRQLVEAGRTKLVIDFGDVPYIDSTALSVLLRMRATVDCRGGALKLLRV